MQPGRRDRTLGGHADANSIRRKGPQKRTDHFAQPAGERAKGAIGIGRPMRARAERAEQAPADPLGLGETREQRSERQPIDVAGVDACEERLREILRRLCAKSPGDERSDRLVAVVPPSWNEQLRTHPHLAAPGEQPAAQKGPHARGNAQHGCRGKRVQPAPRWMNASRGRCVATSRDPRPSSAHSLMPSGFWTSRASGPPSIV